MFETCNHPIRKIYTEGLDIYVMLFIYLICKFLFVGEIVSSVENRGPNEGKEAEKQR